jgi:hypothetical protein
LDVGDLANQYLTLGRAGLACGHDRLRQGVNV